MRFTFLIVEAIFQSIFDEIYSCFEPRRIEGILRASEFPNGYNNNSMTGDGR